MKGHLKTLFVCLVLAAAWLVVAAPALADDPAPVLSPTILAGPPSTVTVEYGQPIPFRFAVYAPDAGAGVTEKRLVISRWRGHHEELRLLSADLSAVSYVVNSTWIESAAQTSFTLTDYSLRSGTYRWHVEGTFDGVSAGFDQGTLRLVRRLR